MKNLTTLKKGLSKSYPVSEPSRGYSENILTSATLSGVLTPWAKKLTGGRTSNYKLISHSGVEYFIVAGDEWREVLSTYCWEEVKVIGLLNVSNMMLIPQKIYPKGPTGENAIDSASWKRREFFKKLVRSVNDLVVIPAAVYAVLAI